MITLEALENSVKFTFTDSDHYLYGDGIIEVPKNSLALVTDSSEMFTFKKAATNDPFISAKYSDVGMTKEELEAFFKENMVGGEGEIDPEEVQALIDQSISGNVKSVTPLSEHSMNGDNIGVRVTKVDGSSAFTTVFKTKTGNGIRCYNDTLEFEESFLSGVVTSAIYDSSGKTIELKNVSGVTVSSIDATDFIKDGMVNNVEVKDVEISGETVPCLAITFNTDAGHEEIDIPLSEFFDSSNYYNKSEIDGIVSGLNQSIDGKLDSSGATRGLTLDNAGSPKKTVPFKLQSVNWGTTYATANLNLGDNLVYGSQGINTLSVSGVTQESAFTEFSAATETALGNKLDASAYTPTDLSEYWTSAQTESAITNAVSGKQDTLIAGSGITIVDNVISAEGGGGGEYAEGSGIRIYKDPIKGNPTIETYDVTDPFYVYFGIDGNYGCGACAIGADEHIFRIESFGDGTVGITENDQPTDAYESYFTYEFIGNYATSQNIEADDYSSFFLITPIQGWSLNYADEWGTKFIYPSDVDFDRVAIKAHTFYIDYDSMVGELHNVEDAFVVFGESNCPKGYSIFITIDSEAEHLYDVVFDYEGGYVVYDGNTGEEASDYENYFTIEYDKKYNFFSVTPNQTLWQVLDSGCSYLYLLEEFWEKNLLYDGDTTDAIKELIQKKQDLLTASSGITIDEFNNISWDSSVLDDKEEVITKAMFELKDAFNEKQDKLVAGSGITIDGNVISAEGGGLDEDFLQANANALYELKQGLKSTDDNLAANYYTKAASDGRYASNASIKKAYYDKAYVDDKLLAISASLNELNDRIAALESQLNNN